MRIIPAILAGGILASALSGCVVYPAYYSAPVAPAYAAPAYYGGAYYVPNVYVGGGWGRGWGGWRR